MNGIFVETNSGTCITLAKEFLKRGASEIGADGYAIAMYATEANRDRAWAMLEKAIAYGARLFRFPTQEEIEKEMQECD